MDLAEAKNTATANRHPWEQARFRFFSRLLKRELNAHRPLKVLDVGSGDAWFSTQLLEGLPQGSCLICWDAHFTNKTIKLLSQEHTSKKVEFSLQKPIGKFDLILLMDVLEHIENDCNALSEIVNEKLNENGFVLISVPAWQFLFSPHDKFLKHFRRYSPKQGFAMITYAGLTPIKQGGLFHCLLYPRLVGKLIDKLGIVRQQEGVGAWAGGYILTTLVIAALEIDNYIQFMFSNLGISLPGLSWWVFCKKKQVSS